MATPYEEVLRTTSRCQLLEWTNNEAAPAVMDDVVEDGAGTGDVERKEFGGGNSRDLEWMPFRRSGRLSSSRSVGVLVAGSLLLIGACLVATSMVNKLLYPSGNLHAQSLEEDGHHRTSSQDADAVHASILVEPKKVSSHEHKALVSGSDVGGHGKKATAKSVSEQVEQQIEHVTKLKDNADNLKMKAEDIEKKTDEVTKGALRSQKEASNKIDAAKTDRSRAEELRQKAAEALAKAKELEKRAVDETATAHDLREDAGTKLKLAADMQDRGEALEGQSADTLASAKTAEEKALRQTKSHRVCIDLPGVKLQGLEPQAFKAIATSVKLTTPEACTAWCQEHEACRQSVFSAQTDEGDGTTCELFGEVSDEPKYFRKTFNSSYCGLPSQKQDMIDTVKKVFKMKPWVPEPRRCAWAGENCMESKCCANVCVSDWQFQKCDWYTCYKQDEYFAGCKLGPAPGNWDGKSLGGHATREVPKAKEGTLTQGTSLFCFCVVMWNQPATMQAMDPESAVANNFKKRKLSIFECEEHAFYDGLPTGSGHNIDSFTHAWDEVKKDGRWKKHDWTVKVDADAVFFPERLRWHIKALRTPQGSPVYLRNTFFKFHFLGAIEVLTREAVELYFDRAHECNKHVGKQGGEDYWLLSCLEGIGVDYQSDYQLLNDKYAANENCNSDWVVAYHFYKKVTEWNWCHTAAINAWNAKHGAPQ